MLIIIILGCGVWLVVNGREPRYKDAPLNYWLAEAENAEEGSLANGRPIAQYDAWLNSVDAMQAIGNRAVPTLLALLSKRDSPTLEKLMDWGYDQPWLKPLDRLSDDGLLKYEPVVFANARGLVGFEMLGTNAAYAAPELLRIYDMKGNDNQKFCAAMALEWVGYSGRRADELMWFLQSLATNSPAPDITYLTRALGGIKVDPKVFVPVWTQLLRASNNLIPNCTFAATCLREYPVEAKKSVPDLTAALNQMEKDDLDTNVFPQVKIGRTVCIVALKSALQIIDPETAAKISGNKGAK